MPNMVAPPQISELFLRIPVDSFDPTAFNFGNGFFNVFNSLAAEAMRVDNLDLWAMKRSGAKMIISNGIGGD